MARVGSAAETHFCLPRSALLETLDGNIQGNGVHSKNVITLGTSMLTAKAVLKEGGRVVLPAAFRHAMKLSEGDALVFELEGDELRIRSAASALSRLQQRWKALNPGAELASEILLSERRIESARE
jgi:AbrB family looped-hinge helix DNA binding protein